MTHDNDFLKISTLGDNISMSKRVWKNKILTIFFALLLFTNAHGQIFPKSTGTCASDTLYVPILTGSIENYQTLQAYTLHYGFYKNCFNFLGINTKHSIIPTTGITVSDTIYNKASGLKYLIIEANNGSQSFYSSSSNSDTLLTLMFMSDTGQDTLSSGYFEAIDNTQDTTTYTFENNILVYDNKIEIFDQPTLNINNAFTVSATRGYSSYKWSYRKKESWNYAFNPTVSYSGADAWFNGIGVYTVSATDEYGCRLSDEEYLIWLSYPGIELHHDSQVNYDDTLTVTLKSKCLHYDCTDEDFVIESTTFNFVYEPDMLTFDSCIFKSSFLPEGYIKTYTTEETTIDNDYIQLKVTLQLNETQDSFEYVQYEKGGTYMQLRFIPNDIGTTEIGMPYFAINGTQAVTSALRNEVEIYFDDDSTCYAQGTVNAEGEPFSDGTVASFMKTADSLLFIRETDLEDGAFKFPTILNKGQYLFCAIPNNDSIYKTTYYGNTASSDSAFVIDLSNYDGVVGLNIDLLLKNTINQPDSQQVICEIKIYPNPVNNELHVEIPLEKNNTIKTLNIFNIKGVCVYSKEVTTTVQTIDVSDLQKSIYIIQVDNTVRLFVKKF